MAFSFPLSSFMGKEMMGGGMQTIREICKEKEKEINLFIRL